eukprot:GHVL01013166.1.p2 GENE.GHVL01013166.1~~GHVL01013166.1.p2  ORF type:complete len:160 (+),score=41.64 GHVL01013166.1:23-502(+)
MEILEFEAAISDAVRSIIDETKSIILQRESEGKVAFCEELDIGVGEDNVYFKHGGKYFDTGVGTDKGPRDLFKQKPTLIKAVNTVCTVDAPTEEELDSLNGPPVLSELFPLPPRLMEKNKKILQLMPLDTAKEERKQKNDTRFRFSSKLVWFTKTGHYT